MSAHPPDDASPPLPPPGGGARAKAVADILFNAALLVLGATMFVMAGSLPSPRFGVLGPAAFPRMVIVVMVCFNIAIIAMEARRLARTLPLPAQFHRSWLWRNRLMLGTLVLFSAYVVAVPVAGFGWATFVFILATEFLLGFRHGWRRIVIAILISLAFSFGMDWVFNHIFSIFLPTGMFS
ncbi:MAG: tripartite tricarboxylate transporter TctB family protein [Candidimonas sp.]|nr:MAG: tripartite tricarboxylate transporter TctB family protein [Candidimonas sp.]